MKKNLKKAVLAFLICIFMAAMAYGRSGDTVKDNKDEKESFYKSTHEKSGISKTDLDAARQEGFPPMTAYVFARIAKAAKTGIKTVLAMHEEGLSWQEMCEKYGVDYEKFMEDTAKAIKEDKIVFPQGSPEENMRDAAAPDRKKQGGGKHD